MSFQSKQWVIDYDALKNQIRSKRQTGTLCTPSESKELSENVEYLVRNLQTLQSSPMEHEISASEIARRQVIIDNLKKQLTMIPQSYEGSKSASSRDSFGIDPTRTSNSSIISSPSNKQSETFNPIASSQPSTTTANTSDRGLIQRQQEVIKKQDEIIVDISKGVDVLHNQALEINQEAKIHLKIIDKLDTNVEKASEGLRAEAEHADRIRRTSSVCFMYILIVLEVVVIVIMLIFMFTLKK